MQAGRQSTKDALVKAYKPHPSPSRRSFPSSIISPILLKAQVTSELTTESITAIWHDTIVDEQSINGQVLTMKLTFPSVFLAFAICAAVAYPQSGGWEDPSKLPSRDIYGVGECNDIHNIERFDSAVANFAVNVLGCRSSAGCRCPSSKNWQCKGGGRIACNNSGGSWSLY